jgi:hypothetical protein
MYKVDLYGQVVHGIPPINITDDLITESLEILEARMKEIL